MVTGLLPLFVALPLGIGFILPLLEKAKRDWNWLGDLLATLGTLALLILSLLLLVAGEGVYWIGKWSPQSIIGIALVADGLTKILLIIINLVSFLAILFSVEYMKRYTSKPLYYSLFLIMVAGMNGVVLSGDLFNLYVFLEVSAIASYALVAFGCESEELEASFKYLILGSLASTFILFGVAILYNLTGTLNMAQVGEALAAQVARTGHLSRAALLATAFFLMGFGLKAAMMPFHAWLPDAHPSAPAPVSAMLSGVVIKALGIYALCRVLFSVLGVSMSLQPEPVPEMGYVAHVLMALGVVSMVVGALLMIGQWDLKRLLAYSSISQLGYVVLALGVGAEMAQKGAPDIASLAIFGGLFHLFNHAIFKSLLFLCSGAIEYGTGTRQLREMGGLGEKMPVTGGCCRIAALSISGVPPFSGFWSKLFIILAVMRAGHYLLGATAVLVAFMTLLAYIKVQRYVLHGKLPARLRNLKEVPVLMCLPMIALAVFCSLIWLVLPALQSGFFRPGVEVMMRGLQYAQMVLR